MSQLGNIKTTYGKPFSIAIANTYASNISYNANLPKNTIIISAPVDTTTYEDMIGTALLVTDNNGEPVLLSKTLVEGNGIKYINDSIGLEIDNNTIKTNSNGELYIDIASVINGSTEIQIGNNGALDINENFVQRASDKKFGVAKADGKTIVADGGTLSVSTDKLDYANDMSHGIVIGDSNTVNISNGVPNVIQDGLSKASSTNFGTLKPNGTTIIANDGVLSVVESSIVADENVGLLKVDGTTITSNNGMLSVNINNISKASSTTYGTIMFDESQFSISDDGTLNATTISGLSYSISNLQNRINIANANLDQIESEISNL